MIIMRHQLKELTASLTALVILAIYVLFHFVYVSVFLAFIFTGLLVLLARLGGANTESEGYQILIFLTSLVIYAKAVDVAGDRFNWRREEQLIIESVKKHFDLDF